MLQQLLYCGHQLQDSSTLFVQYALALPGGRLYCICCGCGLLEHCLLRGLQLLCQLLGCCLPFAASRAAAAAFLCPLLSPLPLVRLQST
jgi:hypothetical protein